MSARRLVWFFCTFFLLVGSARALEPATTGVVVLHDTWGSNHHLDRFAKGLSAAGFLFDRPEMPWSGRRLLDRGFTDALTEIAAAGQRLSGRSARRIVVAGHGLGGNAALAYSAGGAQLAALVLFAPAHLPEGSTIASLVGGEVERARRMVATGRGEDAAEFMTFDDGKKSRPIEVSAARFLGYYDPDGPAAMSRSAAALGLAPILWIAPGADPATRAFEAIVLPVLPPETPITRLDIVTGHRDAVDVSAAAAVEWLLELPAR